MYLYAAETGTGTSIRGWWFVASGWSRKTAKSEPRASPYATEQAMNLYLIGAKNKMAKMRMLRELVEAKGSPTQPPAG